MIRLCYLILLISLGFVSRNGLANDAVLDLSAETRRAKFNYQMHCQGCHTPSGAGYSSVPDLRESMTQFIRFKEGREYMVQVPGSANSVLDDVQLAELLNWMTNEFTTHAANKTWRAYSAAEVAEYRKEPLMQTEQLRAQLLQRFSTEQIVDNDL